jgi:hypothetical protein
MEFTTAVVGALAGAAICLAAGVVGAPTVLEAAKNGAQRQVLKQVLIWGGAYAAVLMGMVLMAALDVLGDWVYAAVVVLWFGPLIPALSWAHRRLDAAASADYGTAAAA